MFFSSFLCCSRYQKARARLDGDWKYVRFEQYLIDSVGGVSLDTVITEGLGKIFIQRSESEKDEFYYLSDVFNAPSGLVRILKDGKRLHFSVSDYIYYIKELKQNRMVLLLHTGTLTAPVVQERRYYFEKEKN
ncbi:MAG: hypothetical protein N2110_07075 [Flavobacteriales bacterium]|nr:hypothetical protein [Flavobacteriales bacterium]MCX7768765.1 hypothetical protein [Flavobacteriales bacterium]MDW8409441.1 hypothetical protein [Flavobacteriales bacterium]